MSEAERNNFSIGIVILAAGASKRMGTPKQLLRHDRQHLNHTFLSHTIVESIASGCRPIVVVLGAFASSIRSQVEPFPVQIVESIWTEGMSASIRCGVEALIATTPSVEAAVILLCDQPFVSATLIDRLVETYRHTDRSIVASAYAKTLGVPALFRCDRFAELLSLGSSEGAKKVILRHQNEVAIVPFAAGAIDIDTPEEYEQFRLSQLNE